MLVKFMLKYGPIYTNTFICNKDISVMKNHNYAWALPHFLLYIFSCYSLRWWDFHFYSLRWWDFPFYSLRWWDFHFHPLRWQDQDFPKRAITPGPFFAVLGHTHPFPSFPVQTRPFPSQFRPNLVLFRPIFVHSSSNYVTTVPNSCLHVLPERVETA